MRNHEINQYIRAHARALDFTTPETMPADPVGWLCAMCPPAQQLELVSILFCLQIRGVSPTQCARYALDSKAHRLPFEEGERDYFDGWIVHLLDHDYPPHLLAQVIELHGVMIDGFIRLHNPRTAFVVESDADNSGAMHV